MLHDRRSGGGSYGRRRCSRRNTLVIVLTIVLTVLAAMMATTIASMVAPLNIMIMRRSPPPPPLTTTISSSSAERIRLRNHHQRYTEELEEGEEVSNIREKSWNQQQIINRHKSSSAATKNKKSMNNNNNLGRGRGSAASSPIATNTLRAIGVWNMNVTALKVQNNSRHSTTWHQSRHFIYRSTTTGGAYRLPLPVVLDDGDQKAWIQREKPYGGCKSIDNHTCRYAENTFGATMTVRTFASFTRRPSVPCIAYDFDASEINYHDVKRIKPVNPESDELIDNGVDGLAVSNGTCLDATLIAAFVPQGAYFAHFMDSVFPRLAMALAHRELLGEEHIPIHLVLNPGHASNDTNRTLAALPNVVLFLSKTVPIGVCYKRVVSVCHTSPGFDPRTGTEISRFVRNAFFNEVRQSETNFEETMQTVYNAEQDVRHYRHAPIDNTASPLYPSPLCTTRVYAGRRTGNHNGRRTMNEEAVIAHLRTAYNFTVFVGGEPLSVWAEAMRNACVFVGAHGGAMSHMFWLNPDLNPAVIEFDGYKKYSVFWYLAACLGHNFGWLSFDKDVGLDLKRLDALLAHFGIDPI